MYKALLIIYSKLTSIHVIDKNIIDLFQIHNL